MYTTRSNDMAFHLFFSLEVGYMLGGTDIYLPKYLAFVSVCRECVLCLVFYPWQSFQLLYAGLSAYGLKVEKGATKAFQLVIQVSSSSRLLLSIYISLCFFNLFWPGLHSKTFDVWGAWKESRNQVKKISCIFFRWLFIRNKISLRKISYGICMALFIRGGQNRRIGSM